AATRDHGARLMALLFRFQSLFGLIAILILAAILSPTRGGSNVFLEPRNLLNIVRFASENGIIAVGMTLVILTAGIDLSVGAVLALCAVGAATCLMRYGWGTAATILAVLAIGSAVGFVNGFVSTRFNIQSFITTLAMLGVARGIASLWAGGYAIPLAFGDGPGVAPPSFKAMFAGGVTVFGIEIPAPVFYFVGVGIVAAFVLRRTGFGRHVYAVGGNETAARLSGVAVDRVKIIVFVLSGLLAGLAALLHAALVNQGSHIDGNGYELNAIAAVVIGGTSLFGGVGTVAGSMIGALTLSVLDNILGLRNIQSEYQAILKGVIIVLAVIVQRQRR
ncbi:MAG TPA: ABC transporter permease, partial [Thermomicrobiales bacterium]|nr:ABC transporter permease [Thermomicrobiales bacterium]